MREAVCPARLFAALTLQDVMATHLGVGPSVLRCIELLNVRQQWLQLRPLLRSPGHGCT